MTSCIFFFLMKSTSELLIFRSFLVPLAPARPTTEVPTTRIITTQPTPSPTCRSRISEMPRSNALFQTRAFARQFGCCCHKRQLTFAWKVLNLAMHWWLSVSRVWIGLSKAEKTFLNVSIFLWHGQQCNDTHTNDFFAFLSGNLTPLFLRLQYILNVFKFRFCYIFVIVDRSKANTWKCLRCKHLTSNTLKTWRDRAITSVALGRLFDARLVRPPLQAHT